MKRFISAAVVLTFLAITLFVAMRYRHLRLEDVEIHPDYNAYPGMTYMSINRSDGTSYTTDVNLVPENGVLEQVIIFADNDEREHFFILLVLVDNIQQTISVNGEKGRYYKFSCPDENPQILRVKVSGIEDDANEIVYLILARPDELDLSLEDDQHWNIFLATEFCAGQRVLLYQNETYLEGSNLSAERDVEFKRTGLVMLYSKENPYTIIPSASPKDDVRLSIGNPLDWGEAKTIVAFCGWEQVPLTKDILVGYVKQEANTAKEYRIDLPHTDEPRPYQVIALAHPTGQDMSYSRINVTLRTIIKKTDY